MAWVPVPTVPTPAVTRTLPVTGPLMLRPVEFSPVTPMLEAWVTSPVSGASIETPKEFLPWTVIDPLARLIGPTRAPGPVTRTP